VITKKVAAIFAALGIAVTGVSLVAPASADPVANTFAIVGSDTLEDAVNSIVNGTTGSAVRHITNNSTMGSFDATGSACIQTKAFTERFSRPNGSSDGLKALNKSMRNDVYTSTTNLACDKNASRIGGLVDIARSSSNPGSSNPATTTTDTSIRTMAWFPFGRDAMAYAYRSAVGGASDTSERLAAGIESLTKQQLTDIFSCTLRVIDGQTITPVVPQSGSGTRSSWGTALGLGSSYAWPSCVEVGQEHDGNSMKVRNAIMPMSVSRWVAMSQGLTVNKVGNAILAGSSLVSKSGVPQAPVTGTGTSMVPNPDFYADPTWGRETWLVVDYDRVTVGRTGYNAALAKAFNKNLEDTLANVDDSSEEMAGYWKKKFGILPPAVGTLPLRTLANN
jgi:ABC-type phosphate transport system substrate-binding protein